MRSFFCIAGLFALLIGGCRASRVIQDPEYSQVISQADQAWNQPPAAALPHSPPPPTAGAVEEYIALALQRNPAIHAARKRFESLAMKVPAAASLQDPMLSMTFYPEQVQTAAGSQEFALGVNQKIPWKGKLATRASAAEAQANAARAELAELELQTVADVKRAYFDLYYIERAIEVTREDQQLLGELRAVANARYQAGQVNQQDVLRADLEISQIESELIRLKQQQASAQARLAKLLHLDPTTTLPVDTSSVPPVTLADLSILQQRAVAARPALHAALAALDRDEQNVELARLDYFPDVTIGLNWIDVASAGISPVANGRDSVLLTAGVNLPIYRTRLRSNVQSAEAQVVNTARQYDSLRDRTLQEVVDWFAKARSQQDLLRLFETDILPRARQTLEVSTRAYNVGEVDFLQLIDNWRRLLRYEITYYQLQASLQQSAAELERLIGGRLEGAAQPPAAPLPAPPQP